MIQHVRELAEKYSRDELEKCIDQQLGEQSNACFAGGDDIETMNVLAKASWIREQLESGACESLTDAIRKLAASMRNVQQAE